jgi:hypothetical protein
MTRAPDAAQEAGKAYRAWVAQRERTAAARDHFDDAIAEALDAGIGPSAIARACGLRPQAMNEHVQRVKRERKERT